MANVVASKKVAKKPADCKPKRSRVRKYPEIILETELSFDEILKKAIEWQAKPKKKKG